MSSEEMFKTPPAKSEFVTRKAIVDRRLRDAGWKIVRFDESRALSAYERCAIEEYPTESGPADYALCVGGKILGIVEAKKLTLGPQNVLMQAERYSKGLLASPFDFRGFRVPFLYSTNGEVIWHHDVRHELKSDLQEPTTFYRDHVVAWSKDLGRTIDYLETRKDLRADTLAYFGLSWGSTQAPIMISVESRIKAAVLVAGGFDLSKTLPEVDPINFAPHVKVPVLMLNGRYDHAYPTETSQKPMFRLLGTPPRNKRHVVFEAGHIPPNDLMMKEILAWLDRYQGPVQ